MGLIDRDAVLSLPRNVEKTLDGRIVNETVDVKLIEALPTIEPIKGRWIKPTGMMPPEHAGHWECSNCGFWATRDYLRPRVVLTNFCPNCGKPMMKEAPTHEP